jgi:hypothetical protein
MKLTRIFALVLVLVMALGIFAGCQQTTDPTTKPNSGNDGTTAGSTSNLPSYLKVGQAPLVEGEDITLKIAIRCHDNTQDPEKTWQYQYLQKVAGCKIEIVEYFYDAQAAESISLLFASGDLPDIMIGFGLTPVQLTQYGTTDELLLDMKPYLNEENAPHILAAAAAQPAWMQALTNSEGQVFSLNGWTEQVPEADLYTGAYRLYYNWDDMNAVGITEAPETLDEFMTMLRAIKTKYPEKYPFGGNYARYNPTYLIMNALGFNLSMGGETANQRSHEYDIGLRNGKMTLFGYDREMLPVYLDYMTKIYAEGLMHPDFYTLEKDATKALLTSGTFSIFSEVPGLYGGAEFGQQWWGGVPMTSELNDTPFYPNSLANYGCGNWCISAETEYPELCVALADLHFVDNRVGCLMSNSPSKVDIANDPDIGFGITTGWYWNAEENRSVFPEWEANKEAYTDQNYWVFENITLWYNGSFDVQFDTYNGLDENGVKVQFYDKDLGEYDVNKSAAKRREYPHFNEEYSYQFQYVAQNCWGQYMTDEVLPKVMYFDADTTARIADLQSLIKPYIEQNLAEFITGRKALTEENLNAYFAGLESLGADEYVQIYQEYWEALNG